MQWLVSYDVTDDRRREKLAKALLDYGQRVQESVFWLETEDDLGDRIRDRLARIISLGEDSLWIVPVCLACVKKLEVIGISPRPEVPEFYIF